MSFLACSCSLRMLFLYAQFAPIIRVGAGLLQNPKFTDPNPRLRPEWSIFEDLKNLNSKVQLTVVYASPVLNGSLLKLGTSLELFSDEYLKSKTPL